MAQGVRRLQVHEVRDGRQHPVEFVVAQLSAGGRGLAHHRVPGRRLIQLPENRLGFGREQLHESRIELAAAAGAGHSDGSLYTTGVMENLNDIGEMHQACRRRHLFTRNAVGFTLAVPALESLGHAVPDRVGEPEVLAERGGGAPVVHIHLVNVVPPVGEKPDAGFDALSKWPAITDVSQQKGDAANRVADVDVRGIVFERLVVPEPPGLLVCVYMASQPGQHRGVVDDLPFLLVHRQPLREMQRDIGLPEHVFGGVAQSKVGAEGERAEEVRHPHAGSLHELIVMPRTSFVRRRSAPYPFACMRCATSSVGTITRTGLRPRQRHFYAVARPQLGPKQPACPSSPTYPSENPQQTPR